MLQVYTSKTLFKNKQTKSYITVQILMDLTAYVQHTVTTRIQETYFFRCILMNGMATLWENLHLELSCKKKYTRQTNQIEIF